MKSKKVLLTLTTFGLLLSGLVGCNNPKPAESSKPAGTSQPASQPASQATSNPASQAPSSAPASSAAPAHDHTYGDAVKTVKNADGKDVFIKECTDKDDKYIGIAFNDYSALEPTTALTNGTTKYSSVTVEDVWLIDKNQTVSWKVNVDKAISDAKIVFGVCMTSSSHSVQGYDEDGTVKYSYKVNDGEFVNWDLKGLTYGDYNLSPKEMTYLEFGAINLVAGENVITLRQNNAGYRLVYGGEVRIHYSGDATIVEAPKPAEGYDITFVPSHCKILVYESGQDYSIDPVETNTTKSRDDLGNICKYVAEDKENGIAEVKPQVNFKVVADQGYVVDGECISVSGTMGVEWNKLASQGNDIYRITKIKADITITVTAKVPAADEKDGYAATFSIEHGTLKVYAGQKNEAGDNLDAAEDGKYYSRDKNGNMTKDGGQFNFEVIPEAGYEFNCGIDVGAEASPANVSFIKNTEGGAASFSNFKYVSEGLYRVTKVAGALVITIVCTPIAA